MNTTAKKMTAGAGAAAALIMAATYVTGELVYRFTFPRKRMKVFTNTSGSSKSSIISAIKSKAVASAYSFTHSVPKPNSKKSQNQKSNTNTEKSPAIEVPKSSKAVSEALPAVHVKRTVAIPADEPAYLTAMSRGPQAAFVERIREARAWLASLPRERVSIVSRDGLKLIGRFYPNPAGESAQGVSDKTILIVHGYRSSGEYDLSCGCPYFWEKGFNLLIIDGRGHGESEGEYITFGQLERYDVVEWCKYLACRFGPSHKIVLDGMSMGCTIVLLAAAEPDLPANVCAVIADCGFVSPYGEFRHVLPNMLHLPVFPTLYLASFICRLRAGFTTKNVSTLDAVKKIKIPVLFVHGLDDKYVPPRNTEQNYDACTAPKDVLFVEGAGHGMSFLYAEDEYKAKVDSLFAKAGV